MEENPQMGVHNHKEKSQTSSNSKGPVKTDQHNMEVRSKIMLEDLPDSLILHVLWYLPHQSVVMLSMTCHRFHTIAHDDLLWRHMFRRDFKVSCSP
jgi:hypothetical protein